MGATHYAIQATAKRPDWFFNYYLCAACQAAAGDTVLAKRSIEQATHFGPYTAQAMRAGHPFSKRAVMDKFVDSLRSAGWPG